MATNDGSDRNRGEQSVYQGRLARDSYSSFSTALVKALAAVKGEDPTDVDLNLYDYIHPEALNTLYQHAQRPETSVWELKFEIEKSQVKVRSDGYIEIK